MIPLNGNVNTYVLLLVAFLNAVTAMMAWRTHDTATLAYSVATETKAIALKTEIQTNSINTALVAATATASHATGKEEGRLEGEAKGLREGQQQKQGN